MSLFPSFDYKTPGQYLDDLLVQRGWSRRVLSIILGCEESIINKTISGTRRVDAALALHLAEVFGVEAEQFLELQKAYDLAQARVVARPNPARATRACLFGSLPVSDMIKRGWIDAEDIRDVERVETALVKFFGASTVDQIEILPHAAKKTKVASDATPAQLAWLYRVKEIASEMLTPRFTPSAAEEAAQKLKLLLAAPTEARKVPRILTESGIRFLLVEALPGSEIDGVTLWLNDCSPVIAMSSRFDRIDNFWFVLRHELEHVIQGHGKDAMMLDAKLEGEKSGTGEEIPEQERIANQAAAEFCVPKKSLESFIARKNPFFHERDIIGFARTLSIHPGLVAGQLQFRLNRYDRFKNHLVKIRNIVAPDAMVDGWGDVAPVGM